MSDNSESVVERIRRYTRDGPVISAVFVGAASYLLGFVLTYLFVLLDSGLDAQSTTEDAMTGIFQQSQSVIFPQPDPTTTEFVGWIFYNEHFAETVITPQVAGRSGQGGAETQTAPESVNMLSTAATQIPDVAYQLIPVVLLTAGGYALARAAHIAVSRDIIRIGLGIPTGYVPFALAGTFLFSTSTTTEQEGIEVTVTASPSLVGLITMAVISTLFGIVGLYLGAQRLESTEDSE